MYCAGDQLNAKEALAVFHGLNMQRLTHRVPLKNTGGTVAMSFSINLSSSNSYVRCWYYEMWQWCTRKTTVHFFLLVAFAVKQSRWLSHNDGTKLITVFNIKQ